MVVHFDIGYRLQAGSYRKTKLRSIVGAGLPAMGFVSHRNAMWGSFSILVIACRRALVQFDICYRLQAGSYSKNSAPIFGSSLPAGDCITDSHLMHV
jgi:hypothetical protein